MFYSYLLQINAQLTDLEPRPHTELHDIMKDMSRPSWASFVNEHRTLLKNKVRALELYNKYRECCLVTGEKNVVSMKKFACMILSCGLIKIRKKDGVYYINSPQLTFKEEEYDEEEETKQE
jgi:Fe-S cluster biosynthesis and repair protein YggX